MAHDLTKDLQDEASLFDDDEDFDPAELDGLADLLVEALTIPFAGTLGNAPLDDKAVLHPAPSKYTNGRH